MNELERLSAVGSEDDRALLRAAKDPAVAEPPPGFADQVRRAVDARLAVKTRRPIWNLRPGFALPVLLVTAGALAYTVIQVRRPTPVAPPEIPHTAPGRRAQEMTPMPVVVPAGEQPTSPAPVAAPPSHPAVPKPLHRPGLPAWPATAPELVADDAKAPPPPAPPAPPRLVIAHEGRKEISLTVKTGPDAGGAVFTIEGQVQKAWVSLNFRPPFLRGQINGDRVDIQVRLDEAEGEIIGYPVNFNIYPTKTGYLLRGALPANTARLELDETHLSWLPGCERDLPAKKTTDGVQYEGTCKDDKRVSVTIPSAFAATPYFPRYIVLAILLTERDPVFKYTRPFLFGEPDR